MTRRIHPVTGCRPDQLFGIWMIDPELHQRMLDICLEVPLEKIVEMRDNSTDSNSGKPTKLYEMNGSTAVISLVGPLTKQPTSFSPLIGGSSTVQAREAMRQVLKDKAADRILMTIESPGGTSGGTRDLYDAIRMTDKTIPVYTHFNDIGASAGYYIGAAGRQVTANANAMLGSIGAYTLLKDTSGRWEKEGVKLHVVSSGKFKGAGAEGTPINDAALKEVQSRVDDIADLFIGDVAAARKMPVSEVEKIADGRTFIASKAMDLKLIDGVMTQEELLDRLNSKSVRRTTVMFNAEQLAQARQLPELSHITEEGADVAVLNTALKLNQRVSQLSAELSATKAKLPTEYPEDLLIGYAELAMGQVTLAAQTGKLLPQQVEQLKGMILPEGKPNAAMLCAPSGQEPAYKKFMRVVELNKPNGLVDLKSGSQPAPQTEPGAPKNKNDVPSLARLNELRAQGGFQPLTQTEYDTMLAARL